MLDSLECFVDYNQLPFPVIRLLSNESFESLEAKTRAKDRVQLKGSESFFARHSLMCNQSKRRNLPRFEKDSCIQSFSWSDSKIFSLISVIMGDCVSQFTSRCLIPINFRLSFYSSRAIEWLTPHLSAERYSFSDFCRSISPNRNRYLHFSQHLHRLSCRDERSRVGKINENISCRASRFATRDANLRKEIVNDIKQMHYN